jgi:hypothetical protein
MTGPLRTGEQQWQSVHLHVTTAAMERRLLEYIDLVMGVIDGSRGVPDVPIDSGCRINRRLVFSCC